MTSAEGRLCRFRKQPLNTDIELTSSDPVRLHDECFVLKQFPNGTLFIEVLRKDGMTKAYCYVRQQDVILGHRPKSQVQNRVATAQ